MGRIILIGGILLCGLGILLQTLSTDLRWWLNNDFAHYYTSGLLARQGNDIYGFKEADNAIREAGFSPRHRIMRFTNPPALVALCIPLTFLSPTWAFLVWSFVQIASLCLLWRFSALLMPLTLPRSWVLGMVTLSVVAPATYLHFKFGQTQLLMGALVLGGFFLMTRKYELQGAFLVGVGLSLKLFLWPLVFLVFRRAGLRGGGAFVLGFASLTGVGFSLMGGSAVESFAFTALPYVSESSFHFTGNISLSAVWQNLSEIFGFKAQAVADAIPFMSFFVLLGASFLVARFPTQPTAEDTLWSFAVLSCLAVFFSPTVWPHYVVLLIPAFWYLTGQVLRNPLCRAVVALLGVCTAATVGVLPSESSLTLFLSAVWGPSSVLLVLGALIFLGKTRMMPTN